jgi:hypothetical protein
MNNYFLLIFAALFKRLLPVIMLLRMTGAGV